MFNFLIKNLDNYKNRKIKEEKIDKVGKNYQSINSKTIKESTIIQKIENHYHLDTNLDIEINKGIDFIIKSRFFHEFDTIKEVSVYSERLIRGDLSDGNKSEKCRALAWCARLLACHVPDKAEECLFLAKTFGTDDGIIIAEAFIFAQKHNKKEALKTLSQLDSPYSRAARLFVVNILDGNEKAIQWFETAGMNVTDLNSEGKYLLLSLYLNLGCWESAIELIDVINDNDFEETPILNQIVAITYLISAITEELRVLAINQVPFNALIFPLAADESALVNRKKAYEQFNIASDVALKLNKPLAVALNDEYVLWLELKDPNQIEQAKKKLEMKLRDPRTALRLTRLGLQFGVELDLAKIEREIERQIAINGEITIDAAFARLALALAQNNAKSISNYLMKYKEELFKFFNKKYIQSLNIEMLVKADMSDKATNILDELLREGLSKPDEKRLRRLIDETKGINIIESLKEQYEESKSISDLVVLIDELRRNKEWDELCHYCEIMFNMTRSLEDAINLCEVLHIENKDDKIVELIQQNSPLIIQSKKLHMTYCWALYHAGKILDSKNELMKLNELNSTADYRALKINLSITLGEWNSLNTLIANEYVEKENRSVQELMRLAYLAIQVASPYAKELMFFVADKGKEDVQVLSTAYFLATSAGWDEDETVSGWLRKAAEMSNENGPIYKVTLQELLNQKPDWDHHETKISKLLSEGELPMFAAAEAFNKSLIHIMLFPALANLEESDVRRKSVIPAYSGNRLPEKLSKDDAISIDSTALLTLSFLGLLDKALDSFNTIYIPHSTLRWLFNEKQKSTFHQPSRFKAAHQIQHFLSNGDVEKLTPSKIENLELGEQVGDELALLISEAINNDASQCIVIKPYPVYELSSFMEREADLTKYFSILSSCQAVIAKLKQKGLLTADEYSKATAYLSLHEKSWPEQPEIRDGATLFLDGISLNYFQELNIIGKLKDAGFKIVISQNKVAESNELVAYELASGRINEIIENIRDEVNKRIMIDKIRLGKKLSLKNQENHEEHPTLEIISLSSICNAIVVDDRFINQHAAVNDETCLVCTTLDLIDELYNSGSINNEIYYKSRTMLRNAGYCFMPVNDEELIYHLKTSMSTDNTVMESAELKAIRENILHVRLRTWFQFSREKGWFEELFKVFCMALDLVWLSGFDILRTRTLSNWIIDQIDFRGWAHYLNYDEAHVDIRAWHGVGILKLLMPMTNLPPELKDEYSNWVEEKVLNLIKEDDPMLYKWLVDWFKSEAELLLNQVEEGDL